MSQHLFFIIKYFCIGYFIYYELRYFYLKYIKKDKRLENIFFFKFLLNTDKILKGDK